MQKWIGLCCGAEKKNSNRVQAHSASPKGRLTRTLLSSELVVPDGGIRGGGSRNFGPLCCEEDEEEGEDEAEGLLTSKGFLPANKWETGLMPEEEEEEEEWRAAADAAWSVDPRRPPLPPLVATVQNMTCACFCRSRNLAYCFLRAAMSNWSFSFSLLDVDVDGDDVGCWWLLDLRKVMSVMRRPVCRNKAEDPIKPPKTVATAFMAFVFSSSSSSSSSASPSGSSSL